MIFSSTQAHALKMHTNSITDETDICSLWNVAIKFCDEVLRQKWEFQGKFSISSSANIFYEMDTA